MPKRYYYQWSADGLSDAHEAWQIFDRQITLPSGDLAAVALCRTRKIARHITELLNKEDH